MIKGKMTDLIKDATGNKFKDRTINLHIENAWNTVVGQLFKSDPSSFDLYVKSYTIPVTPSKPRPYITLPVRTIETNDTANGVRRIFYADDDDLSFVPIPASGAQFYSLLNLDTIDDSIGYLVKSQIVEFWNMPSIVKEVRVEIVPAWDEYADTDDIPLPSGVANLIIQQAVATLSNQPVETNIYKPKK